MIKERELKSQIRSEGALSTARKISEAIEQKHLSHQDFNSIRTLYECFVTAKGRDKDCDYGRHILNEEILSEDAGNITSLDAFNVLAGQLFFNALTTMYNSSDFNIAPLFKVIPSNIFNGDTFAGISNINKALQPTRLGREFPSLEPTQDYSKAPQMRQQGACVDITLPMIRADQTGEIMQMFSKLGESLGVNRELEAASTLTDLNGEGVAGAYPRTNYRWKDTSYSTYQGSTPWVNAVTSNGLVNYENLQAAYLALQNIVDPFSGLPIVTPPGRVKVIVTPTNQFIAQRLARGIQYNTTPAVTDFSPQVVTDAFPPVEFDVVSSKWLSQVLSANSQPQTNWYMCYPDAAFSWQQMFPITVADALPNAGDLFRRNLASSTKAFRIESSYVFNPRYAVRNVA